MWQHRWMTPPIPDGYEATAIVQAPDGTVTVKLRKVKVVEPTAEARPCDHCEAMKKLAEAIKQAPAVPSFPWTEPPSQPAPWSPPVSPFGQPLRREFEPLKPIWKADDVLPPTHVIKVAGQSGTSLTCDIPTVQTGFSTEISPYDLSMRDHVTVRSENIEERRTATVRTCPDDSYLWNNVIGWSE